MVGEIIYTPKFISQLDSLGRVLCRKEYFSFIEDVDHYSDKIYDFNPKNINHPITKYSSKRFQKFGKKYLRYKANNQTFWYIFFDEKDNRFLITYIPNNHSKDFLELL